MEGQGRKEKGMVGAVEGQGRGGEGHGRGSGGEWRERDGWPKGGGFGYMMSVFQSVCQFSLIEMI